jgi:hypothetical protein
LGTFFGRQEGLGAANRIQFESSREIVHTQVGQCVGEVLCRRRRAVRAIAARMNLPQCRLSR